MRKEGFLSYRGRTGLQREPREVPVLEATGIHQVLAWDITLLPGPVKGQCSYLYMVLDEWSRRILGAQVHEHESSELASAFFDRVCRDEGISKETSAILHSDNGAPMRSFTLGAKMAELGVSLSFSRPRVSNDNAFAEPWFRAMKYHQSYPHSIRSTAN
jgi:putative transposase